MRSANVAILFAKRFAFIFVIATIGFVSIGVVANAEASYFHVAGESRAQIIKKIKIEQENYRKKPPSYEELKKRELVEKIPNMVLPGNNTFGYGLVPYRIRRNRFDSQITLTASEYSPVNYQTDYLSPGTQSFSQLYSSSAVPMVEASYMFRYNFSLGALAVEGAYGYYNATSKSIEIGNASLAGQETRLGLRYIMDTLWREPVIAPYIMGGAYQFQYSETQGNSKLVGRTNFAPYWGFGAFLQLNWLDARSTVAGYNEAGVENWYLFAEAREYMSVGSSGANEKDFSSPLSLAMGLSVEL